VEKFICSMMWEGKKSTAQRVFYGAMDQVAKKTNDDALKIFKKAIENVKPLLEVKTRRVGGRELQVPVEVNPFPAAVAGDSLAAAVFAGARRQDDGGQAGG